MPNAHQVTAGVLFSKYLAEKEVLELWREELEGPSPGSKESALVEGWRDGWIVYLDWVIAIGQEKMNKLEVIINEPDEIVAGDLVQQLKADYTEEKSHYDNLAVASSELSTLSIGNLTNMLEQEAMDRDEYSAELL